MDELSGVGLAPISHRLMEALEILMPTGPREVLLRMGTLIRSATSGGYQYDGMAERVLIRVVSRYLADYRSVIQKDEEARRALVEILDTFVRAGSLEARRLSYGLDEIFR